MKHVAKLVIIDESNKYLLLRRSDHPQFPNDPDLPGGTVEEGEQPLQAMLREVLEEVGVAVDENSVEEKYKGDVYASHRIMYHLYVTHVAKRPSIKISWEHTSYDWVEFEDFLSHAQSAIDPYMHMAHDVLAQNAGS